MLRIIIIIVGEGAQVRFYLTRVRNSRVSTSLFLSPLLFFCLVLLLFLSCLFSAQWSILVAFSFVHSKIENCPAFVIKR